MKVKFILISTLCTLIVLNLSGCMNSGPKQTAGTLLGGAAGGLAGAQIGSGRGQLVATAVGAVLGSYLGSEIGAQLDDRDRMLANQTAQSTLEYAPDGRFSRWENPNSGHTGSFVVKNTQVPVGGGAPCREYVTTVNIGGKRQQAYGKACRQADGSWQIVSEQPAY